MSWTADRADAYLSSLQPLGMRFGLERIQRLVSVLGMPQHRFRSVHVVGTNGKSSVAEMTAALIQGHGIATGSYTSPHTDRWRERVRVRGAEIAEADWAAAVERVAQGIESVNRTLDEGDAVSQFEADTAAAFVALAAAGVSVGVIEAGLGGRLDATNVLPSSVTVLTSVGLEHMEYLGSTEIEIATEKLAVLRDHTTLVTGPASPEVEELARATATERHARYVPVAGLSDAIELEAAPYLRRNFAVAVSAAAAAMSDPLNAELVQEVADGLDLHGRMELREGDPPVILDAAHNPAGASALAEALPAAAAGRPVIACLAVLADKDTAGVVGALAPVVDGIVATEVPRDVLARAGRPGARALAASELTQVAREAGLDQVEAVADPTGALSRARAVARERGGIVLVTGSHYLLRYAE
jgi:dihydrofolate synthase / folylpolyglutamate synthase